MELKTIETLEHSVKQFKIEVSPKEFNPIQKLVIGNITLPGFRKGKAPRQLIKHFYQSDVVLYNVVEMLANDACNLAIREAKEADIKLLSQPLVTAYDESNGSLMLTISASFEPDVEIGEYKGITVERDEVVVTDAEIQAELNRLAQRNARTVTVEREAGKGDTVQLDYEGSVDGVAFEGGKAEKYDLLLGSNTFIPGFEDQLLGCKAGDERAVTVTFPENYRAQELAGKEAVFQCKVHSVSETVLPELDDEFAKDVSETCETLDDLKKEIHDRLLEMKAENEEHEFEQALLKTLTDPLVVDLPEEMIKPAIESFVNDFAYRLQMQGMTLNQYLEHTKTEKSAFEHMFRPSAEEQIKTRLVLKKIADLENIAVSDKEIEEEYAKLAEQYNLSVTRVKELISIDALEADLRISDALDFIKDHANVIKKESAPAAESTESTESTESAESTEPGETPAE